MALKGILIEELRDMYSAEKQQVKPISKLAKGVESKELKQLFKEHAEETKGQVQRLREVFEHLGKKPAGKHCEGMEGVIKEGLEALEEDTKGASYDSGILGAALRTEHYEVAGYHATIAMAKTLGLKDVVDLLKQSLEEEVEMARKIHTASKGIFRQAMEEDEEDKDPKSRSKDKESERKSLGSQGEASAETKKKGKGAKSEAVPLAEEEN